MKKQSALVFFLFLFLTSLSQNPSYDLLVNLYVKAFSPVAVKEMNLYHIPASITLAQGIIESGAGQSRLAKEANNHFGVKCHKDWSGKTFYKNDDQPDECFRKYDNPEESYRDHSYFLTQRDRYQGLFRLPVTDYRGWAGGLQAAGYATSKQYSERLIGIIEKYQLYVFDREGQGMAAVSMDSASDYARFIWVKTFKPAGYAKDGRKIYSNNGRKCIVAWKPDDLKKLSGLFDISQKRLMKFNDLEYAGQLQAGQVVYLESKRRKAEVKTHIVQEGETLYDISQHYGIKLKALYKHTGMIHGMSPYPGQVLSLR
jgi:hypothetical protein